MTISRPAASPCSAAINIPSAPVTNQSVVCTTAALPGNLNATNVPTACGAASNSYKGGQEALYTFTPTASGSYTISYSGQTWSAIFVYSGACPASGGTCIGSTGSSLSSQSLSVTLTAGVLYYIWFDTWPSPNSPCPGTFSIVPPSPCASAINIPSAPVTNQSVVCTTTALPGNLNATNVPTACGAASNSYKGGQEALYTFTPTTSGSYTISYSGQTWSAIFVYSGACPASGGTCVGSTGSSLSSQSLAVTLTAGVLYYIWFDTYPTPNSPCPGTFSISAPPVYNPCSSTPTLSCGTATTASFAAGSGASWSPGNCGFSTPGQEKVYLFTSTIAGTYTLAQTSSSFYVDYFYKPVSSGCSSTGWTCIDDLSGLMSGIFTLAAGTQYYILADPESSAGGSATFSITCPVYNPCASTPTLSCGTATTASFAAGSGASWSPGSCGFTTPGEEKVYLFTAPFSGTYTVNQTSSSFYVDYFYKPVSSGCSSAGWTCIDDLSGFMTSLGFTLAGGTQYYILADPESSVGGSATFSITCPPDPCTYTVPYSGSNSITTCSGAICDHAGSSNYSNNANGYTIINPAISGNLVRLTFTSFDLECCCDYVNVYNGSGLGGALLFSGNCSTIPPVLTSTSGPLTVQFTSDVSVTPTGFSANISCVTPPTPAYRSAWVSMNTGSSTWCAGETRNISVTVQNTGSSTWTNAGPDINIGVKWNADADYFIRVDANNLAPNATATYNFTVTAPLTTGSNNLTFDVVNEGNCWFANNSGACGPGNVVFTSSPITISSGPTANAGPDVSVCPGGSVQLGVASSGGTGSATFNYSGSGNDCSNFVIGGTTSGIPGGATITSIVFNATIGSFCTSWYDWEFLVNGSFISSGCNSTGNIYNGLNGAVANGQLLQLRSSDNDVYCDFVTLTFDVTVNYTVPLTTYSWSPTTGLSNPNISNPTASPSGATTYTLTATQGGCSATDQVIVSITSPPVISIAPDPVTVCSGTPVTLSVPGVSSGSSLASVLSAINTNSATLINSIPTPSGFSMDLGVNSNSISDGCSDMYDGGNYINTNLASAINYSDNAVAPNAGAFGSGGQYFTRYLGPGGCQTGPATLFLWAADINGLSSVGITGNNGADGGGTQDVATFTVAAGGTTYSCFLKRVYSAGDPSINQLFLIPQPNSASQSIGASTDDSQHTISGLSGVTRIYYMLYAGASGAFINNAQAQSIAQTFVNILPSGGSASYLWSTNETTPTITVSPTTTTAYSVSVTQSGCVSTDNVTVNVTMPPIANAGSDVTVCPGGSTTLNGTAPGATSFSWSPATGLSNPNIANPVATPGSTTTYTLTASVSGGGGGSSQITYNENFTIGATPTTQATNWCNFRSQLLSSYSYTSLTVRGSQNPTGLTLTDPAAVLGIANALRTATPYSVTSGGNTWNVSTGCVAGSSPCGGSPGVELHINGSNCNCDGAGPYVVRPEINNQNWGGLGTGTCSNFSQNMEVTFTYGTTTSCSTSDQVVVTVADITPPSITCPGTQSVTLGGSCSATLPAYSAASVSDNCTTPTVTQSPAAGGTVSGTGSVTVTLTANDGNGNTASCSFAVNKVDNTPPTITCPTSISVNNTSGQCSAIVNYAAPVGNDNCSGATTVLSTGLASGAAFQVGTTTVTYTVTAANSQTASCSFTVSVTDAQQPSVTCQGYTAVLSGNSASITPANVYASGSDNCGTVNLVSVSPNSFTCANVGGNTVTLTVNDGNGNTATCLATVTVVDNTPPSVTCQNISLSLSGTSVTVSPAALYASGSDACGSVSLLSASPATLTCANLGTNMVTLTVTDLNNNTNACTALVTLTDVSPPTFTYCPTDITVPADADCIALVSWTDPTATDNCSATVSLTGGSPNGSYFGFGTTPVSYVATDPAGATANCSFNVTVQDVTPPSVTCYPYILVMLTSGTATIVPANLYFFGSDNCGSPTPVSLSQDTFTCADIGFQTVTLTVSDGLGNNNTCTSQVEVTDSNLPVAACQNITVQLNSSGTVTIAEDAVNDGSSDICGTVSFDTDVTTFTCANLGGNTVTLTVTDGNNNADNCTATVTVQDVTAPTLTCPTNQTLTAITNTCAANYTIADPVSDNCTVTWGYSLSGVTTGTASGIADGSASGVLSFNVGVTTVSVSGTDASNNTATCSFTVTVTDTQPPQITCAGPVSINTTPGLCTGTTTLTNPTVTDNCAGSLGNALHFAGGSANEVTSPITGLPTGNAVRTVEFWVKIPNSNQHHIVSWGNFTCAIYPIGGVMRPHLWGSFNDVSSTTLSIPYNKWTHVAYVLTGTQLIFYVNGVADAKPFTHNTGSTGSLYVGSYFGATGQTVDEVRIWNTVRTQTQIQSSMGTELAGNESGLVAYYKFNQGTAGGNNAGITTLNATTGQNGTLTGFALNGSSSNWVAGLTFPLFTNNAPATYPVGTTTVTWTATDAAGNTATCSQTVTVTDN
ncbi:hypothetical protein BVG80_00640, partial [Sphingobacteriales bacterium TSM_CSM]